jgi:hypothetical protein
MRFESEALRFILKSQPTCDTTSCFNGAGAGSVAIGGSCAESSQCSLSGGCYCFTVNPNNPCGTCYGNGNFGDSCANNDNCFSGVCSAGKTCAAVVSGSACIISADCNNNGLCTNNVCQNPAGYECSNSGDCVSGLTCPSGICVSPNGAACTSTPGGQCAG